MTYKTYALATWGLYDRLARAAGRSKVPGVKRFVRDSPESGQNINRRGD
jgi:hypothetical protein